MTKKINSEYSIKNSTSNFNIKMGTSNKKNPEVIYSTLTSYITPQNDYIDEEFFLKMDKDIKRYLKNIISINNDCEREIIVVVDIALNRIITNKPSFLDIQVYFKPQIDVLLDNKYNFKTISDNIYEKYIISLSKYIERTLLDKEFLLSKSKSKTIYKEI